MIPVNYDKLSSKERYRIREEYIKEQNDRCWYCEGNLYELPSKWIAVYEIDNSLFPRGFFNNPIHLHHDHKTGMTCGAVHAHCNAVLWQYEGK